MKTDVKLDLQFIQQWTQKHKKYLTGTIDQLTLFTAFQPIYSLAHKRVVGYEALVRAKDSSHSWVSPAQLFSRQSGTADKILLDRLCRCIHLNNFGCVEDHLNWLFLNVSSEAINSGMIYGSFFKDLLEENDFPAHRVVIEVVEQPFSDKGLLMETIKYYKGLGCLIAIDDFGAGHSNFDRIWTLKPDIVKLDRSFLVKASRQGNIRDLLPGIVSLLHQAGSLVLMEGIETMDQALISIESDADFVQGFYFGRPFTDLGPDFERFDQFKYLFDHYKAGSTLKKNRFQEKVKNYDTVFKSAVEELRKGKSLEQATWELLLDKAVIRCYQIGTDGIQIGSTVVSDSHRQLIDKRFRPLEDAKSADWFRRHYLQRAILHPDQLQVTRPYLSITGAHMCITLSIKFSSGSSESVLCCDIKV